jgi:anti-sigma factor RsiW
MMHLSPEAVAGYLDEDLPGEEQRQVELHLASCAECRDELAELRRLQLGRRRQWVMVLVAATAAAAVLLAIVLPRQAETPSDIRAGPTTEPTLAIVSPVPSAEIAPGPIAFTWRSAGLGASYTLTLQEADGRVAWTSRVADTVAVLPDSVALSPGLTWFWFVDALLPDGRSLSTGVRRLRTGP